MLRNEVDVVQSTPDAHNTMLCRLFKPRFHTIDTARHCAIPVSINRHELGATHWFNNFQNSEAQVELDLCVLVDDHLNCNDMNI